MKLEDMDRVEKLRVRLSNCDFHLPTIDEYSLRIWDGDHGGILEAYRDRDEYLDKEDVIEIVRIIKASILRRRASIVNELKVLGVEVTSPAVGG